MGIADELFLFLNATKHELKNLSGIEKHLIMLIF